jgi:hypothetical protein
MKVRALALFKRRFSCRWSVQNQKVYRLAGFLVTAIAAFTLLELVMNRVHATTIVAPAGFLNTEGNTFGGAPTGVTRVQYLYPASHFSSLSQHRLVGIAWRPDESTGAVTTSAGNFALRLSTTQVTELSTTFTANIGPDERLVFDGPLTISTPASTTPRGFDFALKFETPFDYDPTQGNLLVEFITSGFDVGGWRVDNENELSGPITLVQGAPFTSVAAGAFRTLAVMQFTFVPEPSTSLLILLGVVAATTVGRMRRARIV